MTKYEQIKNMTVEEVAELLNDVTFYCRYDECERCPINEWKTDYGCGIETIERYLKSEVEE